MPALNLQMTSDSEVYDVPPRRTQPAKGASHHSKDEVLHDVPTRDRSVVKKWVESRHRRENGDDDDIVSIVTTGDEQPSSEDPHDETFVVKTPKKRSRVSTIQKKRDASLIPDKPAARPRAQTRVGDPTPSAPSATTAVQGVKARRRQPKSTAVVLSSDDDDDDHDDDHDHHPHDDDDADDNDDDDPMDGASSPAIVGDLFPVDRPMGENLFDVEAQEEGDGMPSSEDDMALFNACLAPESDYDYGDPFINDDSELSEHSDSSLREVSPPPPTQKGPTRVQVRSSKKKPLLKSPHIEKSSARVGGHSGAFAAKGATRRPDSVPARRGSAIESASGARVRSTAKNAIGPALRLRDGPPPEVLDISSDDETWRTARQRRREAPRYLPDVDGTPTRSSPSKGAAKPVPAERARTKRERLPDDGTDAKTPSPRNKRSRTEPKEPLSGLTDDVVDPKTPSPSNKRRRSQGKDPLSPWEHAEMLKAIKRSRHESDVRRSRVVEGASGLFADERTSAPSASDVHGESLPETPPVAETVEARHVDRKGKRRADRSPTPPPTRPSPFEDISPEELAAIVQAFRDSRAAMMNAGDRPGQGTSTAFNSPTPFAPSDSTASGTSAHAAPNPGSSSSFQNTSTPSAGGASDPVSSGVLRNDTATARRCVRLPATDATYDPSVHNVVLADTYGNRPNLQSGTLIPWSTVPGRGHPLFSGWRTVLPKMSERVAFEATTFEKEGAIRGIASASPLESFLQSAPGSGNRFHFFCDTTPPVPLVAVSCGWLESSQLRAPAGTGLRQRYLTLNIQSGEWERTVGFISTVSGYPELYAQLARDCLQFSSRAQAGHASPGASSPASSVNAPATMFVQSAASGNSRVAADSISLPNNVAIPVYDARGHASINFNAVLPNLAASFPLFTEEIPHGSFVMVGYTMTVYTANSGNRTLGCNIQWAIVFGCPSD